MYLFVNGAGKYWRTDYRFLDKRKTLALGVHPDVSLAKPRKRNDEAPPSRLPSGSNPSADK
jgi:hypothetical protein